ncbi:MAG: hypothetical protein KDD49_12570, partial [Bacteroidetes bacterium]|nr:hypothetical protein [Bacteroidota bacterium]
LPQGRNLIVCRDASLRFGMTKGVCVLPESVSFQPQGRNLSVYRDASLRFGKTKGLSMFLDETDPVFSTARKKSQCVQRCLAVFRQNKKAHKRFKKSRLCALGIICL